VACFAEGDTALVNVAHARIKETDRIAVMAEELGKFGVKSTERPDGLVIHGRGAKAFGGGISQNAGTGGGDGNIKTDGRGDHRIVMALACAALGCPSPVEIAGAESASVTYPGFLEML
jgi:3-phosphoshikimate 1-carboxyvinyltransferase